MTFTISLKTFFSCCFDPLKKEYISNFNKILLKNGKIFFLIINFSFIWWATLFNNSLYESHGTYVSRFTFFAPRRSQKTTINFVTFVTEVELTSWCLLQPWSILFYHLQKFRLRMLKMRLLSPFNKYSFTNSNIKYFTHSSKTLLIKQVSLFFQTKKT